MDKLLVEYGALGFQSMISASGLKKVLHKGHVSYIIIDLLRLLSTDLPTISIK